jgi:hypothetical protein
MHPHPKSRATIPAVGGLRKRASGARQDLDFPGKALAQTSDLGRILAFDHDPYHRLGPRCAQQHPATVG